MPKLNTKSYYYEVLYTPYTLHGKTCAKDVKIGAGHPYPEKKSTAPVAVTAVTKKIVSKTLPLVEYLEAEEARYVGASPKLGIISLYNGHYALISDCYINKKLVTDQEYAPDGADCDLQSGACTDRNGRDDKDSKALLSGKICAGRHNDK